MDDTIAEAAVGRKAIVAAIAMVLLGTNLSTFSIASVLVQSGLEIPRPSMEFRAPD